jgi:hypothetical protein
MSSSWILGLGLHTSFAAGLCLRLTLSHTLTQHTVLPSNSLNLRETVSPQNVVTRVSLSELIKLPFCLWRQSWIWTRFPTSLMSGASKLVTKPFQVPLCDWNLPPQFARTEASSPWITCLVVPDRDGPPGGLGKLSQWQGGENITLQIPDKPPKM